MINLITTNSYYNLFPTLISLLKQSGNNPSAPNVVFCEEKVSLMIERMICYELNGSFNTEVYSFGNFLRVKKPNIKALSKEGSAMVVKRILSNAKLNCFKASKKTLAPSLAELIMQLKSAKVLPEHILQAINQCDGALKSKLTDIELVYREYENYISENGVDDQSSSLLYLPNLIEESIEIKRSNVYIVGFSGFTAQIRSAISALNKSAKEVTAILTEGENPLVFVNETANFIRKLAKESQTPLYEKKIDSDYTAEAQYLIDTLYCSNAKRDKNEKQTESIYLGQPTTALKEVERVGQIIKTLVMSGKYRYRDFTLAIPSTTEYGDLVNSVFNKLDVPFFLDERKKPDNHPLITLINSYFDLFKKNFERRALCAYFKNPLFEKDKTLTDAFESYLYKYNVNYSRINSPFSLFESGKEDLTVLEPFRQRLVSTLSYFNVRKMLNELNVEQRINEYTNLLNELGEHAESAVNEQVYNAVISVLDQIDQLLGDIELDKNELKSVFDSGISALEISIIPQYNDAVFVGGYKETALAKAKQLFVIGLSSAVPQVQQDVALLADADIDRLEQVKLLIEPKIRVVNHRSRENLALALCAFTERLYVTCPLMSDDGGKAIKSEVFEHIEGAFSCNKLPDESGYLTEKQGMETFAKDCGLFVQNQSDFIDASAFFTALGKDKLKPLLDYANKELQVKLECENPSIIHKNVSPTTIEDYFKCPYKAFLSHKIKLKNRDDGEVKAFSVGTLAHDIFSRYTKRLGEVTDKQTSNALVEEIYNDIILSDEYKRYMQDGVTKATIERVLKESKNYCYKTYLYMCDSAFKIEKQEAPFGNGKDAVYPAVSLLDGQVNIRGTIDRVDSSANYYRVLDYKTGKADIADKNLYSGIKLQLYLYSAAVSQKNKDKQLAGLYYLPVAEKYVNSDEREKAMAIGKTLKDDKALCEQDLNIEKYRKSTFLPMIYNGKTVSQGLGKDGLDTYVEYAIKVSELGAKQMKEGVIVPSASEGVCKYCEYKAICSLSNVYERKVLSADENVIYKALKGGDADAKND